MAVSISLSITQNSQSIANNTSNVTVKVTAKWTYGSFNRNDPSGSCTINGTKYPFTSDFNASQTTSGSQTIYSKTLNIAHGSDGKKTLSCSASYVTGVSSGTVTASASKTLTTIPRKSTMSVGNGTLGTAQTLTVTRKSTSFTHTIVATCGSASTTICTKSTSTSIPFTPPIAWSSQNTTGTSVSVKYTITTYSGSTSVGSNSYTVSCAIPASVKPSCSLTVSDPTGYLSTYGAYIQGLSKFTVSISASGSYGSTIKSYKTVVNGGTYTASSFTTGAITTSGTYTINTTITDSRSRTATASKPVSVTVLAYAVPKISAFSVTRCNQDGTANTGGSYIKVAFNSSVTSLSNKNKATYTLKYKKASEASYTNVTLSDYANNYAVSGGYYIFAADSASSYNITLTLSDNFKSVSTSGTGATASKTVSLYNEGKGIAFGKVAETENLLDVGYETKFNKSVYGKVYGLGTVPAIPENSDLNNYLIPGMYAVKGDTLSATIKNIPLKTSGVLVVAGGLGNDIEDTTKAWQYVRQTYIPYQSSNHPSYEREIISNGSGAWGYGAWLRNARIITDSYGVPMIDVPNATSSAWLKTPTLGLLPYTIGTNSSIGSDTWRFKAGYFQNLYMANSSMIYGKQTNGTLIECFCACSSGNNTTMGYGSYTTKVGITKIFGNSIEFTTNNTITSTHSLRFANAKYVTGTNTSGSAYDVAGLSSANTINLGHASLTTVIRGSSVRLGSGSGTVVTSDQNLKTDIQDIDEKYIAFFKQLQPKTYKYKLGNAKRPHIGFIAQEVEQALNDSGLTTDDFAGICIEEVKYAEENDYDEFDDMNYAYKQGLGKIYSLRYEEFISLNTRMIQYVMQENEVLKDKIQTQQEEIDTLKEEMQQLKEMVAKLVS